MMHPATTLNYIGADVGFGVVATETIPAGTLVWVRDRLDQVLSPEDLDTLSPHQRDLLRVHTWSENGRWYLTWDHGRYTNHSCSPNCAGLDGEFDIAIRDIQPGEQITDDYAWLGMDVTFDCRCGSPSCRFQVAPGSKPDPRSETEAGYRMAMDRVAEVPQPLAPLIFEGHGVGFSELRSRLPAE